MVKFTPLYTLIFTLIFFELINSKCKTQATFLYIRHLTVIYFRELLLTTKLFFYPITFIFNCSHILAFNYTLTLHLYNFVLTIFFSFYILMFKACSHISLTSLETLPLIRILYNVFQNRAKQSVRR